MQKIKRVIPIMSIPRDAPHYSDMAELALIFNHEIIEDESGVWRWKENRLMSLLLDNTPICTYSNDSDYRNRLNGKRGRSTIDLNALALDLYEGKYTMEERMKFHMQIGYSLGGFADIFGQHEASEYHLEGALIPNGRNDEYTETVIDYMRRIYEDKRLAL